MKSNKREKNYYQDCNFWKARSNKKQPRLPIYKDKIKF